MSQSRRWRPRSAAAHEAILDADDCYCRETVPEVLAALRRHEVGPPIDADDCYCRETVPEVLAAPRRHEVGPPIDAANLIASRSPIALAVTLEAVRRAGRLDSLEEVLRQEFRTSCAALQSRDLVEGIRALLVDKDRNPRWSPASLAEVTPESIDAYFAPPRT